MVVAWVVWLAVFEALLTEVFVQALAVLTQLAVFVAQVPVGGTPSTAVEAQLAAIETWLAKLKLLISARL